MEVVYLNSPRASDYSSPEPPSEKRMIVAIWSAVVPQPTQTEIRQFLQRFADVVPLLHHDFVGLPAYMTAADRRILSIILPYNALPQPGSAGDMLNWYSMGEDAADHSLIRGEEGMIGFGNITLAVRLRS